MTAGMRRRCASAVAPRDPRPRRAASPASDRRRPRTLATSNPGSRGPTGPRPAGTFAPCPPTRTARHSKREDRLRRSPRGRSAGPAARRGRDAQGRRTLARSRATQPGEERSSPRRGRGRAGAPTDTEPAGARASPRRAGRCFVQAVRRIPERTGSAATQPEARLGLRGRAAVPCRRRGRPIGGGGWGPSSASWWRVRRSRSRHDCP
jgi:hypothetical protein